MKAQHEQALRIGWNAEAFARTKRLKPIEAYLKPEPTMADKRAKGAADVGAMLRRLEKRGKAKAQA